MKNLPILITGEAGSGKSSLISHWIRHYKSTHKLDNDYFLYRFVRATPNDVSYEDLLYSIYTQLREFYHLPQKVDLVEDSLRINFRRWVELANAKQQSSQVFRKHIIIVVDSVDKLKEANGREELPEWLPSYFPENIRVLVSCNKNSRCYNYLVNKVNSQVQISGLEKTEKLEILSRHLKNRTFPELRDLVVKKKGLENPLFLTLALHFALIKNERFPAVPLETLKNSDEPEELFSKIVSFYQEKCFYKEQVLKVLACLAISRCGLSQYDLTQITKYSDLVKNTLEVFAVCLFSCDSKFFFRSELFARVVLNKAFTQIAGLRSDILAFLNKEKVSIKAVLEKIYQFKEVKEWLLLKDTICSLEVFFIMFTPQNRLELIKCWNILFSHNFDPVQEYNKTLEQFTEKYSISNQELFIVLVQLCRFFKEFSKLEPNDTSEFRHPPFQKLNEIKELTLYEEFITLSKIMESRSEGTPDLIKSKKITPLEKDETITAENKKSWNHLREVILNEFKIASKTQVSKKKQGLYHYKRWIWIQFPWCCLDVFSDFSQISSVFNLSELNHQHDNEMSISTLKIIKDLKAKSKQKTISVKKEEKSAPPRLEMYDRSVSAFVKATGILQDTLPPLNMTIQTDPVKENLSRQMSRGASTENIGKRLKSDYNFDLMFKELTPSNVLVKVGTKVANYSNYEIQKKKKENNELQTSFNKLVNESRMKTLQLQSIKSQIAKSEDKMKESREISAKIEAMKKQMEKIYEKINKAEVESKRLETIISCCFKNTAKNELWEKSLEKGIHNITGLIEAEQSELDLCEEEKETLESQIAEFEKWFQDKIKIQENTLDRVVEQFSFKASIKETLVQGENKRLNLVNTRQPQRSESYFLHKLKERKNMLNKVKKIKQILKEKIRSFEETIKRIQAVTSISGPQDLTSLIWQIERKQDLIESKYKLDDKLKDLKSQKDALEVKLVFLKQKDLKLTPELNLETLEQEIIEKEKKISQLAEGCKRQEITYYACEGTIKQILNLLNISEKRTLKNNYRDILKTIADRLNFLSRIQDRPQLIHSHTLKVSTLQVPYSSKFNLDETPVGSSSLNTPGMTISERVDKRKATKLAK